MDGKNKIKLLYLLPGFRIGGIEKQLTRQWKHFDLNKFEIFLVTIFETGQNNLLAELPSYVKVYEFNLRKNILGGVFGICKTFYKIKPHIVVSSMFSANFINRVFKLFFRYISIPRENNIYSDKKKIHFWVEKMLSHITDIYVSVSEEVIDFASTAAKIPRSKFVYIPNGIEISEYKKNDNAYKEKEKLGLNPNLRYFIHVARIKPQKNQNFLLDFFKEFQNKNPGWGLIILGDGSDMPIIQKKISSENIPNLYLLGYQKNVSDYYKISDIFALTSLREGFPNVVLEALSYGLPILTSKVPGVAACVKNDENGYILDLNIVDFVNGANNLIKKIDNETEYKQKVSNSILDFDIAKIAKKYQDLFIELYEKNNN